MFDIAVVNAEERFLALADEWRELASACEDLTYFLTWEFISIRWKYFSPGRELWVLTARDGDGKLVGIAPWAIGAGRIGPLAVRRLEFLCRAEHPGHQHPFDGEDLDVIAPREIKAHVTAAFVEQLDLHRSHWDVTDLAWLSTDSALFAHETRSRSLTTHQISTCYITTLPEEWPTYEESVLGKSESRRIRRHGRRLERDHPGSVDYHLIEDRNEVGPAMDHLIKMNLQRWTDAGQHTVFDDERFVRFHREFVEQAFDRGWLRFYQLKVGESIAAATCGIVLNGTYFLFQKGFDPEWSRYGPGVVLQAYELQKAIEEGCERYDWAPGAFESKQMWIDTTRDDFRSLKATAWKGNLFIGKEVGIARGKALARRVFPRSTYQHLKRLVASLSSPGSSSQRVPQAESESSRGSAGS